MLALKPAPGRTLRQQQVPLSALQVRLPARFARRRRRAR
jgi:hypothetical protein